MSLKRTASKAFEAAKVLEEEDKKPQDDEDKVDVDDSDEDDIFGDAKDDADYDEWTNLKPTFDPEREANLEREADFEDALEYAQNELEAAKSLEEDVEEIKTPEEVEEDALETQDEEDVELEIRKRSEAKMSEEELETKRAEAKRLKSAGNDVFLKGEDFREAVDLYSKALDVCPLRYDDDRGVYFSNRAAANLSLKDVDGALADCNKALELKPDYPKALARRGRIFEEHQNKPHEAMTDFQRVLELDKDHAEARAAVQRLPAKMAARDEEIKAEMFDNLKKLGNMVLNPFGLNTENFQFVKDEQSGSYSVNFKK